MPLTTIRTCSKSIIIICLLLLSIQPTTAAIWDANFTAACERELARLLDADNSVRSDPRYACGQGYSDDKLPAVDIQISLAQCLAEQPGWERSRIDKPGQWAGPLVGFLLPSLAFVIVIPREWNIRVKSRRVARGGWVGWVWPVLVFVSLVGDTLLGVAVALGWAASFIAGALYEVLLDHIILKRVSKRLDGKDSVVEEAEWYVVAVMLVGSFAANTPLSRKVEFGPTAWSLLINQHRGTEMQTFADVVQSELADPKTAAIFLNRVRIQFLHFSQLVGVPLVFYIGAFIFGLTDANARLGENDTAHSVAFGLWYFVIVLVAIVSSTVLGVSEPNNMKAALAHHGRALSSRDFRHKWLSERRKTLAYWSEQRSLLRGDLYAVGDEYYRVFHSGLLPLAACVLSVVLIAVPCGLAITVSYWTPRVGFSCRSVTMLAYLCAQTLLVVLWFFHSSPRMRRRRREATGPWSADRLLLRAVSILYVGTGFLSLAIAIAGTVMQLIGVYRNCVCKAGLWYSLPTTAEWQRAGAKVLVSTDTEDTRQTARLWIWCGIAGILWVGMVCLVGAVHRIRIREELIRLLKRLAGEGFASRGAD